MKKLKNKDLQRINIEEFKSAEKTPITIVLDNVRSALNVGSVFRTSDAFLIEKIILCGITATPPNKEIRKAALGSTDSVNWKYIKNTTDAVKQLIKDGYHVVGIEQVDKSTKLNEFELPKKPIAIIMGNEVNGVSIWHETFPKYSHNFRYSYLGFMEEIECLINNLEITSR
jgi:23S rRNA (guanosine2251-2'-O)-methyltransferase